MFPSQIGVAEGGTAVLFQIIGLRSGAGVALQIVSARQITFYIAFGLQALP